MFSERPGECDHRVDLSGLTWLPMMLSAPTSRGPWMTLRPTTPSSNTMHLAQGSTLVLMTAPTRRRHATADVADLVGRRILADLPRPNLFVCALAACSRPRPSPKKQERGRSRALVCAQTRRRAYCRGAGTMRI